MTTPAREAEADRVELVYYWALNQLGNATYLDAVELWQDVPKTGQAATAAWWLHAILSLVSVRRAQARDLAIAYYRLIRALRTGYTITDPVRDEGESVSLEDLRDQFEAEVDDIDAETAGNQPTNDTEANSDLPPDPAPVGPEPAYTDDMFEDDEDILTEEIADLDALIAEEDQAAEQEAAVLLDQLGIENMLSKLEKIDQEQAAADAEAQAQQAHEDAGRRQAAVAQRISMNAARGLTYDLADYDGRVLGWVRYSQTGTPCGYCAMLLSRQVFYKTKASAQHQGKNQEENKFHDNCRCVAVPVFTREQFENSDLFALNREYHRMWNTHIKGLGGDAALTKWRRLIRKQHKQDQAQAREAA